MDDYIMKVVQSKADSMAEKNKRGDMTAKVKAFIKDGSVLDLDRQLEYLTMIENGVANKD